MADVTELIADTLSSESARDYIDAGRIEAITDAVQTRLQHVRELAMTQKQTQTDSVENDVIKNVAEDYTQEMTM